MPEDKNADSSPGHQNPYRPLKLSLPERHKDREENKKQITVAHADEDHPVKEQTKEPDTKPQKPEEKPDLPKPEPPTPQKPQEDKPLVLEDESPKIDKAKQNEEFKKALEEIAHEKPPAPIVIGNRPTPVQVVLEAIFRLGLASVFFVIWRYIMDDPATVKSVAEANPFIGSFGNIDTIIEYSAYASIVLAVLILVGWQKRLFLALAGVILMGFSLLFGYPVIF